MSDIIYTPPASGGSGTTINPTNNFIPVRSNATTFIDSNIENDVGNFLSTVRGLKLDFNQKTYFLGDFDYNDNGTNLNVDDGNQVIKTQNQGNDIGLKLDFANFLYQLGDYNGSNASILVLPNYIGGIYQGNDLGIGLDFVNRLYKLGDFSNANNWTNLSVDDNIRIIKTSNNGNDVGLNIDFANEQFGLGDYNGITNGNYIIVDNTNTNEVVISANQQLNIKGNNIQDSNLYSYAVENLRIKAPDGNIYYIPLYK